MYKSNFLDLEEAIFTKGNMKRLQRDRSVVKTQRLNHYFQLLYWLAVCYFEHDILTSSVFILIFLRKHKFFGEGGLFLSSKNFFCLSVLTEFTFLTSTLITTVINILLLAGRGSFELYSQKYFYCLKPLTLN